MPQSRTDPKDLPVVSRQTKPIEREVIEKVIPTGVQVRKAKKESMVAREVRNISTSLYGDVILPAIKDMITSFVTNGLQMALFGDNGQPSRRSGTRPNYGGAYLRHQTTRGYGGQPVPTQNRRSRNATIVVDDILFEDIDGANVALDRMDELIARYGIVTVGDLYTMVGGEVNPIDQQYGWTSVSTARILREPDGFTLDLPKPVYH